MSVTLLGLSVLAAATLVFALTFVFIAPQDTLERYVPADAVAYLHVNVNRLDAAGRGLFLLPENYGADEAAKFVVLDEAKETHQATLVGWRFGRRPTAVEERRLREAGALALASQTYLLADDRTVRFSSAAYGSGASLADDFAASRALAAVRGLASVQVYFNPLIAPPQLLSEQAALLKGLDPTVGALDFAGGVFYATALPVRQAAAYPAWLGFAPNRSAADLTPPSSANLTVALAADGTVFNPLTVFFGRIEGALAASGTAKAEPLAAAKNELRSLLSGPVSLSLSRRPGSRQADVLAVYPELDKKRLEAAVSAYLAAASPEKRTLRLPDDDIAVEYRFSPGRFNFRPGGGSGVDIINVADVNFELAVSEQGGQGTAISSNPSLLSQINQLNNPGLPAAANRCLSVGGSKMAVNGDILYFLANLTDKIDFRAYLSAIKLNSALFIDNGDGILITCGY